MPFYTGPINFLFSYRLYDEHGIDLAEKEQEYHPTSKKETGKASFFPFSDLPLYTVLTYPSD